MRLSPSSLTRQNSPILELKLILERDVKVYQIILLLWVVVFAFWLVKQFSEHNKRSGR
jgi:hypothetical protein